MINTELVGLSPLQWSKVGCGQQNSRYNKKANFLHAYRIFGGLGDWGQSVKKGKIYDKNLFQIVWNEGLKSCKK